MASATLNGTHFWLVLRALHPEPPSRRLAAIVLVLLNMGLALQATFLLGLSLADALGRDVAAYLGGGAALVRGPALAGSLLLTALIIRDWMHTRRRR